MQDGSPVVPDSRPKRRGVDTASLLVGVILILLGAAFFLERAGVITFAGNWWAAFIYLAAIASFANSWRSYRDHGRFGAVAGGSLTWGLVFTVVASIFWFDLSWGKWWPAILIAVGAGMVLSNLLQGMTSKPGEGAR